MGKVKRHIFITLFTALVLSLAFVFAGCVRAYGNDRSKSAYCDPVETEEEYVYDVSQFTYVNQTLNINKQTGEARVVSGEVKGEGEHTGPEKQGLSGNDFPGHRGVVDSKE